mmetsp:Transcript_106574/g.339959  ORF Transcript_106574/g.339959 Transcript_106574/m.339959 type:complete len:965 (-) Transcript_106574:61-2955(-)
MAHFALPPMLGDPCHHATSSTFHRDQSKMSRHTRERLASQSTSKLGGPSSPSRGSLGELGRSLSSSKLQKSKSMLIPLPPIMKAKRAVTFEEIYATARLRVAKKTAVERKGGCAPHLQRGLSLPEFPSGIGGSRWSMGTFDSLNDEDSQTRGWAASALDLAQDERASKRGPDDGSDFGAEADMDGGMSFSKDPAGGNKRTSFEGAEDNEPAQRSAQVEKRLSRFRSSQSIIGTSAAGPPIDAGLVALLETLSARFEGRSDGLSETEINHLQTAFNRFKIPGESDLYTADLQSLLNYLGHILTGADAIAGVLREVTQYDYLDFNEFLQFIEKFFEYEREEFRLKFEAFDEDRSGEISILELRRLTKALGYHPQRQMTEEALNIVDADGNGQLSFDELCMFLAVYSYREGFTTTETAELRRQFDRFSVDSQGPQKNLKLLPPEALSDALVQVFGLEVSNYTQALGEQLASGQGLQKSTFDRASAAESMSFAEFLIFARRLRENEHERCLKNHAASFLTPAERAGGVEDAKQFDSADADHSGGISERELRKVLKSKSYTPLRSVLDEIFAEVYPDDWDEDDSELDFDQFFDFMLVLNRRDGFMMRECEELRKTYERFDEDDSGEVSAMEVAALFRHVGYRVNLEDIRDEVSQVDANGSGQLDFREFLRLMRLYREKELDRVKKAFEKNRDTSTGSLPLKMLDQVLEALGNEAPFPDYPHTEDLSFDDLVDIVDSCRSSFVAKERKKAGFSDVELEEFEALFHRFDKDHSKTIDNKELQGILKEFGWEPRTREEQQELISKLDMARQLAREAGVDDESENGSPDVKFWAFVQLIRMLRTDEDKAEEKKVLKVMQELRFSEGETEEFRQVFRSWVRRATELAGEKEAVGKGASTAAETIGRDGVHRLVRSLGISINPANKDVLDQRVSSLDEQGRQETARLDFCSFLRLMRWLLDSDFAGINDAAAKHA